MLKLIQTNLRVIGAIAIREINGQETGLMYGYAWALVDTALGVVGLLMIKLVLRGFNTPGMPPATFILSAIMPFGMFSGLYGSTEGAIRRHRKIRSFPIVTELDCVLGSSVQVMITRTVVLVVAVTISSILEQAEFPVFFLGVLLILLAMWSMGISFGLVLMLVYRIYPPAAMFISVALRPMMILSSVFIPITKFPGYTWKYLTWNPLLHAEELLHGYWFRDYHSPVASASYLIECVIAMAVFGLLCERYARARVPPR
jgi:capsular polysaccharide transport system permease protein